MAAPPTAHRPHFHRLTRALPAAAGFLAIALVPFLTSSALADVQPDYFAAEKFGAELQQDFQKRHSAALIERLDGEAMKARTLGPMGEEVATDPAATKLWQERSFPQFCAELRVFDDNYTLIPARVALIDGARWLECVFYGVNGSLRLLAFRLSGSAGAIRIDDLHFGGSELEATRMLRQTLILYGLRAQAALDDEEALLCVMSDHEQMRFADVFAALVAGNYEHSFTRLVEAPEGFQRMRIWRDLRGRLAMLGSARARQHFELAVQHGEPVDAFTRFALSSTAGDKPRALADFGEVLNDTHGLCVLRALHARMLLDAGRAADALASSREILETNPLSFLSYAVAVQAALAEHHPEEALALLQAWNACLPASGIEKTLASEPGLKPFLSSPAFAAWKKTAREPQLLPSPEPPAPVPAQSPAP